AQAWQRLQRPPRYTTKTGRTRARRDNVKEQIVVANEYVTLRLNHEDVAEFTYRPGKCKRSYRVVVYTSGVDRLFSVWTTVERIRFAGATARAG
ncbi:MAG: hypothetical protein FWJ93_04675, partial [Micromonosporaceae bacterium]